MQPEPVLTPDRDPGPGTPVCLRPGSRSLGPCPGSVCAAFPVYAEQKFHLKVRGSGLNNLFMNNPAPLVGINLNNLGFFVPWTLWFRELGLNLLLEAGSGAKIHEQAVKPGRKVPQRHFKPGLHTFMSFTLKKQTNICGANC